MIRSPLRGLRSPLGRFSARVVASFLGGTFGAGFAQRDSDWQDTEGVTLTTTTVNSITAALSYINSTVNAAPGSHYRITVTTGGAEDANPQINRNIGIVEAGGSCVVVGDGTYRLHSRKMLINGVRGVTFQNFRFYEPIDRGVLDPASAAFTAQLLIGDFSGSPSEVYFKDCQFGAFGDNNLFGATLGAIGRTTGSSKVMVKECVGRKFLTFWRVSNSSTLHLGQSYFDGKTDDIVDMDAGGGSATLVMDGLVEGLPYDEPIVMLKIWGDANESGLYQVGETVTQNGIARGTVVRVIGSGYPTALDPADGVRKGGVPVTAKIYIEKTAQFIEGFAVVGATSGATSAVVGVGGLNTYSGDGVIGSPYAGLHGDFAQWGVSSESAASRYNITIRNCVAAGSGINHASAQGTFAEYNSAGVGYTPHRVYIENFHTMSTGFWGMSITAPDGVYRNITSTWPPLGARMPGALAEEVDGSRREPTPITGGVKSNLRFAQIPADFTSDASMVFENIIASGTDFQNLTAGTRWNNILPFTPSDRITVADVTAASGATSYGTLFGAATYDTDQWVETGPTVPMTDTVYVAMARWLQWVRDNREPAVGWGVSNWIDPVTFADVEAAIPVAEIVPTQLVATYVSGPGATTKTITTTTAASGAAPVYVAISMRYSGTANTAQDVTGTLNGVAMTKIGQARSNNLEVFVFRANAADVPASTFNVVMTNNTALFNGFKAEVLQMAGAKADQTGAALYVANFTSNATSRPAFLTTTADGSYMLAVSATLNVQTAPTGADDIFSDGTTNSGNTVTFGAIAGLTQATAGAASITFNQPSSGQIVTMACEVLKA